MLDIKEVEKDPSVFKKSLEARKANPSEIDRLLELNQSRKLKITGAEEAKADQNRVSKEIAKMKQSGEDATVKIAEMKELGTKIKGLQLEAEEAKEQVNDLLLQLPNLIDSTTPIGASEEDNKIVREVGSPRKFSFEAKTHDELGEKLDIIDFERAAKVTGARFAFLKADAAKLERALANFMLDLHTEQHSYIEMQPPFLVNSQSMQGTGQFPKFKEDSFHTKEFPFHLVPTAEVPVTNYFANEILNVEDLPISFCAYTPCFRSEAGSHGRDTKGLIRQHQFTKVELVKFTRPEESEEQHELLTHHAEEVLKRLELPYRVSQLCSADIGFSAAKCYDLEVWLPGQEAYREISSCSNFKAFQARRAGIRFKEKGGKPQFVHTINGSGLAVGRTLLAVMENYQQEDGSLKIPKVLKKYY